MFVYELKKGDKIYCQSEDGSKYITFENPAGMYSCFISEKGNQTQVLAAAEVVEFEDGFIFGGKK